MQIGVVRRFNSRFIGSAISMKLVPKSRYHDIFAFYFWKNKRQRRIITSVVQQNMVGSLQNVEIVDASFASCGVSVVRIKVPLQVNRGAQEVRKLRNWVPQY